MSRLSSALLAAVLLLPVGSSAQTAPASTKPSTTAPAPAQPSPALTPSSPGTPQPVPGTAGGAVGALDTDPAVRELIRREVEKAKEDMRDEMRAELQGAQSRREFMETAAGTERTKLDFLQLHGYLRVRGDLFDNLDLHRAADPSGYYLFPRPLMRPDEHATLTSGNMRFRLEPTLNVSEQVRVLAQIDMLDNVVFGSTPEGLFARADGVQFPFDVRGQVPPQNGVNADRSSIVVKRAWAEVETPVGLLSFGRMPSSWGLGILSHAGNGIDDDYGDSVDRIQFAVRPLKTPIGPIVIVPMYDVVWSGVSSADLSANRGIGQPFDRDQADDVKSLGIKVVRIDTDDEVKRKLERDETSLAYGAWYSYKSQRYEFPMWVNSPSIPSTGQPTDATTTNQVGAAVKRDASAHVIDLWFRTMTKRFRWETEFTGVIGQINNVSSDPSFPIGPALIRQFGGATQAAWNFLDGKLTFGGEFGLATGDGNPGFGNKPGRNSNPKPGDIDGAQFHCDVPGTPARTCDQVLDIRNFRFNPAYRVDLILWREILGGVTDAWYLKPSARYEFLDGFAGTLGIVYSQAMFASSTPSTAHAPLGVEFDFGLSYKSDDGFIAFLNYGLLIPLDGLGYPPGQSVAGMDLKVANAIRTGLAVKF